MEESMSGNAGRLYSLATRDIEAGQALRGARDLRNRLFSQREALTP
jgi:hypothetical protein